MKVEFAVRIFGSETLMRVFHRPSAVTAYLASVSGFNPQWQVEVSNEEGHFGEYSGDEWRNHNWQWFWAAVMRGATTLDYHHAAHPQT